MTARILRTFTLALCYSVRLSTVQQHGATSVHTKLVDVQLNHPMKTISGVVRCAKTDWLPALSNITPPDIRREAMTSRLLTRVRRQLELPLFLDIDNHLRRRLSSRHPVWACPVNCAAATDLWRARWQNTHDIPNMQLVTDPTAPLSGMDLPRGQWCLVNRFRTEAGLCHSSRHKRGYADSPNCDCGVLQTMCHIVNECPITHLHGGINYLHKLQDNATKWLADLKL